MLRLLLPLLLLCATGCSSFHGKWKYALEQPRPTADISGPWEGRWISDRNGHTGRLRCLMTQNHPGVYDAHFHATFWKIFRAAYEVPFAVRKEQGLFLFHGESNLGKLAGGVYTYDGAASPTNFNATYTSKYDHGRFEMHRPPTP